MTKKKIVKPTAREKRIIEARLKARYPQMYESVMNEGTKTKLKGLSPGDRAALEKMVGKRLKKIYRSK